jgi:hypothetical protein
MVDSDGTSLPSSEDCVSLERASMPPRAPSNGRQGLRTARGGAQRVTSCRPVPTVEPKLLGRGRRALELAAALGEVGHLEGVDAGGARLQERLVDASQEIVEAAHPLLGRGYLLCSRSSRRKAKADGAKTGVTRPDEEVSRETLKPSADGSRKTCVARFTASITQNSRIPSRA